MKNFLLKYEKWIPFLLALLFIAITASGLYLMSNPDELVHRVDKALKGRWQFDETNFDYPSLPKYIMFGIGKLVYGAGQSEETFKASARFFSVLLGAGVIFLVYHLSRKLGGSIGGSVFATLILMGNKDFSLNARFAHNDFYLLFFLTLSVYFSLLYLERAEGRGWLYAAFFSVGLAASSKYNGGVLLLLPLTLFLVKKKSRLFAEKLHSLETLFIGAALSFLGFALGTPKALLWMAFYLKRMLPALSRHAAYGKTAGGAIGLIGQWSLMRSSFGTPIYFLFLAACLYFGVRFFMRGQRGQPQSRVWVLLFAMLLFDLPIMTSYNYQARFFLPILTFGAALIGLLYTEVDSWLRATPLAAYRLGLPLLMGGMLVFVGLQVVSLRLLLVNDPRQEASQFLATLPQGTKLEYTMYPPEIPLGHFEEEYNYPIFFPKFEGQETPKVAPGKPYDAVNEGEAGLLDREVDYFVADSFTYGRCANEAIYQTNPVECDFFEALTAGESAYQLIGEFTYDLPPYLPQIRLAFVNPDIYVFQRKE